MTKSLKIFLAILALVAVVFSLAFFFELGPFSKQKDTSNNQQGPQQNSTNIK